MVLDVTPRLRFSRLSTADVPEFHRLATDAHIRRYLLDDECVDVAWCEAQWRASDALFATQGVGLWVVRLKGADSADPMGFCGFIRLEETGPEPQLLYALLPAYTGLGYATEIARALVEFAATHTTMTTIYSGVDEPNRASVRVLEKVGFQACGAIPGAFGRILQFRLPIERNR